MSSKQNTLRNIPLGGFGLFSSLLIAASFGFLAFFATAFVSIMALFFYDLATGTTLAHLDYDYKFIALPVGIVALIVATGVMLTLWFRNKLRS